MDQVNVGKTIIIHPPVITIFIGGMFTIPSHGVVYYSFTHIEIPHFSTFGQLGVPTARVRP
jgi:hypothetical protein